MERRGKDKKYGGRLGPKLIKTVIVLVTLFFVAFFAIVAVELFQTSRSREIDNQRSQIALTAGRIQSLQSTIRSLASLIVYNDVVQRGISGNPSNLGDELYAARNISETLKEYQHIVEGTEEITIYTTDGQTLTTRYVRGNIDPENTPWFKEFLASGRSAGFTGVHSSVPQQSGYTADVFSYITGYYSLDNYRDKLGELIISVEYQTLLDMVSIDTTMLRGYALYDGDHAVLVENGGLRRDYEEIMAGAVEEVYRAGSGDIYVVSDRMEDGWVLISEISGTELVRGAVIAILPVFAAFVVMLLVLVIILRHMIRRVTEPINALSVAAESVGQGDFSVSVDIHTEDEVEDLARAFNRMVVDINELMNASVEHEKKIQQMQTENLMLQINPHFIYNTMNSIVYMARMEGNTQIADFTNAFISLLQSTLRVRNSVYTTLGEEMRNVRSYLFLQSYRYGNKFTYETDCPAELENCRIVSVMLQPVAENAIFHGLAPKEGTGHLVLRARVLEERSEERQTDGRGADLKEGLEDGWNAELKKGPMDDRHLDLKEGSENGRDMDHGKEGLDHEKSSPEVGMGHGTLRITIRDDGVGMDPETLALITSEDYVQKGGIHKIGIGNVRARIREIYGEPYALTIESTPGEGTTVRIDVPLEFEA